MSREDLFVNSYAFLEANGVRFEPITAGPPFMARIDLNQLKVAVIDLIRAFGGTFGEVPVPRDVGEVMALLLSALPAGSTSAGVEPEPGYLFAVAGLPGGRRYRITVEKAE
jgi:hypothetical protein